MTGWRLGWITAPTALGPSSEMLTEYNIAGPPGCEQRAGIVAVRHGASFVAEVIARYRAARDLVLECIAAIPRLSLPRPEAAFYAFIRVEGTQDSIAFAKDLLMKTGVASPPAPRSATAITVSITGCACASPRRCRPSGVRSIASRNS
jgi:aspartate/methionine/tyrosine aminotransferase